MADARDEQVWSKHSQEMEKDKSHTCKPVTDSIKLKFNNQKIDILDYGCGTAQWAPTFKDFNYHIYDQNKNMIQGAQKRLSQLKIIPKEVYCNIWNQPNIKKQFDVVWTSAVIQHNTHKDKEILMPIIYSLIKNGGYYICLENTLEAEKNALQFPQGYIFTEKTTDGYSYTRSMWLKYFKSLGFVDESESCMKFWGSHKSDFYVLRKGE